MKNRIICCVSLLLILDLLSGTCFAQGTEKDYERALALGKLLAEKVYHGDITPVWIGKTSMFFYENNTASGKEYILIDAVKNNRRQAFNTVKLADALRKITGDTVKTENLPL
jgi:hypothetical protein